MVDPTRCTICREPFTTDDMVLPSDNGGEKHVRCSEYDEPESEDGPLHPDETIPVGYPWEPGR